MSRVSKIYFLIWFICMFLLAVFFSSNKEEFTFENLSTQVASQDEIYFKNIRSFFYTQREKNAEQIDLYNYKDLNTNHPLSPTICNAWRTNQALVLFENIESFKIAFKINEESIVMDSANMNGRDHLRVAYMLYHSISENHEVHLIKNEKSIQVKSKDLNKINIVLKDYFRLIGELR